MLKLVAGVILGIAGVTAVLQAKNGGRGDRDAPSSPKEPCIQPNPSSKPNKGA